MSAALVAACVLAAVLLLQPRGTTAALRLADAEPARRRLGIRGRRALVPGSDTALVLELVAATLATGAPPAAALGVVGDAVGGATGAAMRVVADRLELGADDAAAWSGAPEWSTELRRCLELSSRTGAPASRLLQARARDTRRRRHRAQQVAAQRLGVRVVLPLGLCALPGFAAWGVAPVVLGLAAQVTAP